MMRNIFNVSAITVCLFAMMTTITSCEKEELTIPNVDEIENSGNISDNDFGCSYEVDLTGVWEWVQSSGGLIADTVQQEQLGYPVRLEITVSSIKRFENNDLVYDAEYRIEYAEHIDGYKFGVLFIEGIDLTYLVHDCGDYLFLDEQIPAGYRHFYIQVY